MITPRQTRLVRVADLHEFRRAIAALAAGSSERARTVIVVPSRAAGAVFEATGAAGHAGRLPRHVRLVTRDGLYDELHRSLPAPPRRLSPFERDALAQSAAADAARAAGDLPFQVRPGLVTEMLRFYDTLKRQSQHVDRFEELIVEALGGGESDDRGSERLLRQTRFLAEAFRGYERRVIASGACDEHALRDRLIAGPLAVPVPRVVVTVSDWIADPAGLYVADFDLLTRVAGIAELDLICTAGVLASGFHERIHGWWPGLEEIQAAQLVPAGLPFRPSLIRPPVDAGDDTLWFTHRDRHDELSAVAARLLEEGADDTRLARTAVVFKQPLPYLYLAPETLGAAGLPFRVHDALPLAAEPVVATLDLILDALESSFSRVSLLALLRSPHLALGPDPRVPLDASSVAAMNRVLSDARFLGGGERLDAIAAGEDAGAEGALAVARGVVAELSPLMEPAPASRLVTGLRAYLAAKLAPTADVTNERERRGRTLLLDLLAGIADAHQAHHDPVWTVADLAAALRRWIGDETFDVVGGDRGVHLLDDRAVRYGDFDDITLVGLVETEWPEKPRRNIFYSPGMLKALGWPSERDRRGAADARFVDLLSSATSRVELSTFTLDDETLVSRSVQLDEVPQAKLSTDTRRLESAVVPAAPSEWDALRGASRDAADPRFHGAAGTRPARAWSISALETYLGCPFKFFAQYVLRLEEEPDDEEIMDPRRQGQFVHEVFEEFFRRWQNGGHGAIGAADLPAAREIFTAVVDARLTAVAEGERGLERTRLLGSAAAAGLGEAVFRMEAERDTPVVERLLEHELKGDFVIAGSDGPRTVPLRGKVDRIDLLADGTFRLIDYKLGWPPDRNRALQLPVYGLCAEQRLAGYRGRTWTLGEAVYLAFKGPKRVVPLFTGAAARDDVLARAQQRLLDAIDAIGAGQFPPSPDDVYRCDTCAFAVVCRKDYVGDI